MERLGITYDVLPRESEILHLKFWDAAFALLKERGAIHLSNSGKTAGCWVMRMTIVHEADVAENLSENASTTAEAAQAAADDDAKIIVRSNGTVTYVGKDIAYQLWKFGLLGRDFHYQPFHKTPDGTTVWTTTTSRTDPNAPEFGHAYRVYNVIDARQSYLQNVVVAGLRALDFDEQAHRSTHFSYEIVALTPRCASELGYELSAEDAARSYVEVSGRRGLGVKADDLLDKLEAAARAEVDQRHAEVPDAERAAIAHSIAIGALRYFMLRFARNTIIAFDFDDALSFEGETGPYCQYAVVRIRGIWRKEMERRPAEVVGYVGPPEGDDNLRRTLAAPSGDDLWEVILLAGSLGARVEAALKAQEPSFVAKYCFELSQSFNNFYHKHHILSEEDAAEEGIPAATLWVRRKTVTRRPKSPRHRSAGNDVVRKGAQITNHFALKFIAKSISVLTPTPVAPFGIHAFASSYHAVPAISRCTHGTSFINSRINIAPVIAPPPFPLLMF